MKRTLTIVLFLGTLALLPRLQAQQTYLGGQVGIAVPTGTFNQVYQTGFGGHASFMYNLIEEGIWVNGQIGYITFSHSSTREDISGHWATVPLLGSLRYQLGKGNFRPYVGVSLGYNFVSRKLEIVKDVITTIRKDETEAAFGGGLLAGFFYPITPSLLLDATLSYNFVNTEQLEEGASYMGIMVGVAMPVNF